MTRLIEILEKHLRACKEFLHLLRTRPDERTGRLLQHLKSTENTFEPLAPTNNVLCSSNGSLRAHKITVLLSSFESGPQVEPNWEYNGICPALSRLNVTHVNSKALLDSWISEVNM